LIRVRIPGTTIRPVAAWLGALGLLVLGTTVRAQTPDSLPSPEELKRLSLEQLMAVEVSSVSRRPERLSEAASAIQVITREDIRRSGATRLPEVLRLATNLQVTQFDAAQWAISARGFNSPLANKLLVLIDGRSVYSPLFAGVFWDAQNVFLEDIEQIEVISGPGATLWGANAVNGVINITTRKAHDTDGALVLGGGGTELHGMAGARYGGAIGSRARFRVHGKYQDRDGLEFPNGDVVPNDYAVGFGGFRVDWDPSASDQLTFQGDLSENRMALTGTSDLVSRDGNLIARWTRRMSNASDLRVQTYFDRVHRDLPGQYDDVLKTYDLDVQHRIALGTRNEVVWGVGYRHVEDDIRSPGLPPEGQQVSLRTFSAFAQDEIALVPDRLHLTLGTKLEHNEYTDFEVQPSARLAWRPTERQTLWGAASRAIRTPSRLDRDFLPGQNFDSEKLMAYELGYRLQAADRLTLSLATFYHDYDDLRSAEIIGGSLALGNGQEGESYGLELTARYQVTDRWQVQAGLSELRVDIGPKPGSTDRTFGRSEAADSRHRVSLRSSFDLSGDLELDAWFRYVSRITNPNIAGPPYAELDLRLGWLVSHQVEVSLVGQNLLHARHVEFGVATAQQAIKRGVYVKAAWAY
jgi:iron complex outermembrane recepter protein